MSRRQNRIVASSLAIFIFILSLVIVPKFFTSNPVLGGLFSLEFSIRPTKGAEDDSEVKQLSLKLAALNQESQENARLRELLHFYSNHDYTHVVSYITSHDPLNTNLINLAVGSADGVAVGQAIIVDQGIIIGKIIKVQDHKAIGELLTSDFSKLTVSSAESQETTGLVVGSLGNSLTMQFIPTTTNLEPRQLIVTSGLETAIPRGLVVGLVETISSPDSTVYKVASIKPTVNYQNYFLVSVITQ
jgi:rod shape-determining protein MreC